MSDTLKNLYNNCHPLTPAPSRFYIDLAGVRGGDAFIEDVCERLNFSQGNFVRALFTGHQGSGKSTELEHLAHIMQKPIGSDGSLCTKRYFPVIVRIDDLVDINNVSIEEILLAVVIELADTLNTQLGIELHSTLLERVLIDVKRIIRNLSDTEKVSFSLWGAKLDLGLKRAAPTQREQIRHKLQPTVSTFIEAINEALDNARSELRQYQMPHQESGYTDLVLILDNMEKVLRVSGESTKESGWNALFIDGANLLLSLQAHCIYTVPLSLHRSKGEQLTGAYGVRAFVLPNVKTEVRRTHELWQQGHDCLREVMAKRVFPLALAEVMDAETCDYLITNSGGDIRQLMVMLQQCALDAEHIPITLASARKAIRRAVQTMSPTIRPHQWQMLAELELSENQSWDNNSVEHRSLLENHCVMEYVNGGENENEYESGIYWYAVHPIIRHLSLFQNAVAALQSERSRLI